VYTNDIYGLCVLQLLEFHWNITYWHTVAWHTVAWIMDLYLSGITQIDGKYDILPGIFVILYLIIAWWCPDVNLYSSQIFDEHHVEISTGFVYTKCIHWVHFWKTPLHNMYTTCIHLVSLF